MTSFLQKIGLFLKRKEIFFQPSKDVIKRELEYSNFLYKYNNNINYYFYL